METKDILKQLRFEKNLSMDELCEKLNKLYNLKITKSMISRWENGQASPNNTYLSAYAKFFNIDLNYLVGLTDTKRPLYFINPELETLNKRETLQLKELLHQNAMFFNDDSVSDDDKEKFLTALQEAFYEVKFIKQQERKNKTKK
ncbi:helix-turn-helix domain-containing protein [Fusobacterium varium]|uniref:XRE family transcriptional regulator n=1 Tax=Fusobacterium varium ATCC 27725 TaxID=469618 RepID=A0ABM6U236_FUSVA|nr:helix-turn-helix transcriptional regulator [Fusobacterium varium]AVQ30367.1 XRE family transcriptional regulator [Fusobacterium varium ATCC 27725]EES64595.1 DNA-binding helix-turn-helix protein [Fusobacterium varium ATCC 27725]VEH37667.1 Helix-turn-helix domain [Fusobacterium varium]